ncbi:MAG: SNF2 family helicase [Clostridiales bacterium]|nr:SNF2 family helicase [Clostridiales bacterium]
MLNAETLRDMAGEKNYLAGQTLMRRMLAREMRRGREECVYAVVDNGRHQVRVTADEAVCDCGEPLCRHAVAALLTAMESGAMQEMENDRALRSAPALMEAVAGMLPQVDEVRMTPVVFLRPEGIRLALRVGEERLYVVRSVPGFLKCRETGEPLPFGKGFEYKPGWMRFSPEQEELLDVLSEYCEAAAVSNLTGTDARIMRLPPRTGERVLGLIRSMPLELHVGEDVTGQDGIGEMPLDFHFLLTGTLRELTVTAEVPEGLRPVTEDYAFVYAGGTLQFVPPEKRKLLSALARFSRGGEARFTFPTRETPKVLSELMPFLSRAGQVTFAPELEKQLLRLPLTVKVFLDKENADVTARVTFAYGDMEIDPFQPDTDEKKMLLVRDVAGERAAMDELARSGFHVQRGKVYLRGQDRIYDFVTEGAQRLTGVSQVFFSRDFQKLSPRRPALRGAMRMAEGRLQLELMDGDAPVEELMPLMEALRRRRRYFRYKDGTFLDLTGLDAWQKMAEAVAEAVELTGTEEDLGACWAAYFDALLRESALPVEEDEEVRRVSGLRFEAPPAPLDCLRPYQQRGFAWLCALHEMHLGGILADEMGLGKTVQTIAALLYYIRTEKERKPSLIVSPTTLTYNWLSELKRFAPELDVLLISGGQGVRAEKLARLEGAYAPDVVITSYPLIRRDIQLMQDVTFRFAILDEAQQVKNAQSVGAHAVKQLRADTRIALTGTPMENHAGELWSLFDFVLPGYLPRYSEFLRRWGDGRNEEDLRFRIRPFLMRRLKRDVLGELPEKQESVLTAEMTLEQARVYDAALLQKRARVGEILREKGLGRGRAEVLSAITELRQICCHPRLCLPDYQGASGKLEMLMELLPGAVAASRRILLFSQFTSMLRLIEARLKEENLTTLYLDGETPAAERLALTERFNAGEGDVFLISLKAGGTGLNLTGADTVIHFDPWWNPTAEEQATGRAHRIGQTHKVEVWKLVCHNTIEEQVLRMSDRKRSLFDRLITPGEEMPTRLSEKDILALFD